MEDNDRSSAAAGGAFGALLALVTGSTVIGVAIVAAVGAGLAVLARRSRSK